MDVKKAYDLWAQQYDTNHNKTRDLEAVSLRTTLEGISFKSCLEIGCGTGKNTEWLVTKAEHVIAVDLSEEMLARAKEKVRSGKVHFQLADITREWNFKSGSYDLITFSLVLEHIEDLEHVFRSASQNLSQNGFIYIGELHPFKQYTGTKARFDTEEGQQIVTCFTHHISDFTQCAKDNGLEVVEVKEYFDENDKDLLPRILTLLFRKKKQ